MIQEFLNAIGKQQRPVFGNNAEDVEDYGHSTLVEYHHKVLTLPEGVTKTSLISYLSAVVSLVMILSGKKMVTESHGLVSTFSRLFEAVTNNTAEANDRTLYEEAYAQVIRLIAVLKEAQ